MGITYYLMIPFTWLLKLFYSIFQNYGMALILFTLVVKVILFPLSLKGKRSMIQMNMLSGQMQRLQKQYANNQQKYNEEVQKLYEKEGVSPMGGCLWSMIPMLILFPLYAIIRRPLKYWLGLTDAIITNITTAVTGAGLTLSAGYPEISIASAFYKDPAILTAAQPAAEGATLYGINFNFLGIDLAATPTWKFWENGLSWASIGLFLIPVICALTSFLSSKIMMKTNEINSQAQQNKQNNTLMWMSPIMMLFFSFIMPAGMGLYMIASSIFQVVQEIICGKMLKKDYEQAEAARKQRELEEKEEEKRQRREKAEQRAREAEEARKNKGKKKEKPAAEDKMTPEQREASREGIRQYARGRAYDPNRYGGVTPYHDGQATIETTADKAPGLSAPEDPPAAPVDETPKTPTDRDPWDDQTKE